MERTGHEYPDETRSDAYRIWCAEGEQSTRKTAQLLGIPLRTVQYWRSTDDWQRRWLAQSAPESEVSRDQARVLARHASPAVMRRMLSIVVGEKPVRTADGSPVLDEEGRPVMQWASEDRDAINAGKLIALYGIGNGTQDEVSEAVIYPGTYTDSHPDPQPNGTEPSIEAVRAKASAMLEATVGAVNTRTNTKGKRRV